MLTESSKIQMRVLQLRWVEFLIHRDCKVSNVYDDRLVNNNRKHYWHRNVLTENKFELYRSSLIYVN